MDNSAKYIWLDAEKYPGCQLSRETREADGAGFTVCMAQFVRSFTLDEKPERAVIDIFADTRFRLMVNGRTVGMGPVSAGGDFRVKKSLPLTYYSSFPVELEAGENKIFVEVRLSPEVLTETSKGRGGLIADCAVTGADGGTLHVVTDETWLSRRDNSYEDYDRFNYNLPADGWSPAAAVKSVWDTRESPIPVLREEFIAPVSFEASREFDGRISYSGDEVKITNGSPATFTVFFDKIHAAFPCFSFEGGDALLELRCREIVGKDFYCYERIRGKGGFSHRSFRLYSVGCLTFTVTFLDEADAVIKLPGIVATSYPDEDRGAFRCSDGELNDIYDLCRHTLGICRQSLHLDSPLHQEHLACTGDYLIESLMAYYAFGDTKLSRFDIVRTAAMLVMRGGKMFHTTYSLIFVRMITDYYRFTGDKSIFAETRPALDALFALFETYLDSSGMVTNPPDYMFVDHIEVDGFSMHHPPRALGQTVLNAFYYDALTEMVYICRETGDTASAGKFESRAARLKEAFPVFWDADRGLYFDGLDTPQAAGDCLPANTDRRYFSQHSSTLAVLCGLAPEEERVGIMRRVITDESLIQAQPYFLHFVLEALYKVGLFGEYGLDTIRRWTRLVRECPKGLKEVFGGFDCDYSHAWGGTPMYQLASKISGLEIVEPGFKKIRLAPDLYGLERAHIVIPTPMGGIEINLRSGSPAEISLPDGISLSF